jgi:putative nucleotidyltransferase with HDIG domain
VLIGAAALFLSNSLSNPFVAAVLAIYGASNAIAHWMARKSGELNDKVQLFAHFLRYMDGMGAIGAGFATAFHGENLWLLAIPVLISESMVSRNIQRVATMALAMIAMQSLAEYALHGRPELSAVPAAFLAVAGGLGLMLARFRSREEVLSHRDRRLSTVLECGNVYATSRDLRSTLLHTLKAAVLETQATCGYIMLAEVENVGPLVAEVAYGEDGQFEFPITLDFGFGLSGYVAKMGQPISVSDRSDELSSFDGVTAGVRSALAVPLVTRTFSAVGRAAEDQVLGVITLLSTRSAHAFSGEDMDLVRTLASLAAVAVANARMEEKQHTTFVRTLESLATALEARDEYTRGHSQRVCEVSLMLGERMGFSPEALEELRIGTVLHDIGKIGVPDAILNKRGRLTDEEFDVMKTHPVIGYEICKPLMLSEGVLLIIRNHHEKLDGSGYPDGLKGGELPLSLRIVCVADAFDAMSSKRPYRGVMSHDEVMSELSRGAGTQFDPVIVEHLKELLTTDRMSDLYQRYWDSAEQLAA